MVCREITGETSEGVACVAEFLVLQEIPAFAENRLQPAGLIGCMRLRVDVVIEEMRKRALELLTDEQLQRCTWKHWDLAADPELEAGAGYDVVLDKGFFCASLFGGTAHAADCLWACVSALRPGGVLIQVGIVLEDMKRRT